MNWVSTSTTSATSAKSNLVSPFVFIVHGVGPDQYRRRSSARVGGEKALNHVTIFFTPATDFAPAADHRFPHDDLDISADTHIPGPCDLPTAAHASRWGPWNRHDIGGTCTGRPIYTTQHLLTDDCDVHSIWAVTCPPKCSIS